jgi:microcystin-dependent protein
LYPLSIDNDSSLPHLIPQVSDVSATDYLALKSAILALENTVGVFEGPLADPSGYSNGVLIPVAQRLKNFATTEFVPRAGNVLITGPLTMDKLQRISFGSNCETYVVFAGENLNTSITIPAISGTVSLFPSDSPQNTTAVVPLAIVGNDASPSAALFNRRVKIFDDLDVNEDLRVGRDLIVLGKAFLPADTLIGNQILDQRYIMKGGGNPGGYITGDLSQFVGSYKVLNPNSTISLSTTGVSGSPLLVIEDMTSTWKMGTQSGILRIYSPVPGGTGISLSNSLGSSITLTVGGPVAAAGLYLDDGAGRAMLRGQVHNSPYAGATASPNHYMLNSSQASRGFNGEQDLIDHLNNTNAHHEELHSFESHLVQLESTGTYRAFNPPPGKTKSLGQMIEDLISGVNADGYHTHSMQQYWWTMQATASDSTTIRAWVDNNYCSKAAGCNSTNSLNTHRTATVIDHPDRSITAEKIDERIIGISYNSGIDLSLQNISADMIASRQGKDNLYTVLGSLSALTTPVATSLVAAINSVYASLTSAIPSGTIIMWGGVGGPQVPAGFVMCDGAAYSRTAPAYARLFNIIGTRYGAGDGATTFNVPNLVGRYPKGATTDTAVGAVGGNLTHTHVFTGTATVTDCIWGWQEGCGCGFQGSFSSGGNPIAHRHPYQPSGTNSDSSNEPPYVTVNYIIKL